MSKTLLNGVNEVLKRVSVIDSNNELSSLTNSGKQVFIDLAVQAWNEAVDHIFSKANVMKPYQGAEDSITLVAGTRTYSLASDLIQIRWPLQDETNGLYINEYPGGYEELRHSSPQPSNMTGTPFMGAISPIEKELYLSSLPTSTDAGNVYKYLYWRDTVLVSSTDVFPFDDAVFRAMIPVVSEIWRLMRQNKFVSGLVKINYGTALRMIKQQPPNQFYVKRTGVVNMGALGFDPLGD